MITTETETSQVMKALGAGASEYVMKPFTAEILRDKLEMLGLVPSV
jgi:two-component system chemotaxis response regulator CheY